MKDVIVLTTNTCPYCRMAKEFLAENKIHYIEKNADTDSQARREMAARKIAGVPAFIIGDDVVIGLDKQRVLDLVDHRLVRCPECGASVRVPTREGKIKANCPKCKTALT